MKSGDLVGQTFLATYSFVEKIAQNHTADTTCVCVQQKHLFISFRVEWGRVNIVAKYPRKYSLTEKVDQ
jgi:hypothetical protein